MSLFKRIESDILRLKTMLKKGDIAPYYTTELTRIIGNLNEVIKGVNAKHENILKYQELAERNEKELMAAKTLLKKHGLLDQLERVKVP